MPQLLRMMALASGCFLAAQAPAWSQPRIARDGVLNHGSFAPYGVHNGSIAQGSLFAVFGDDLGPAVSTPIRADDYPLATTLAGVSIQVNVAGKTVDALPLYVSARRLGALLPSSTPLGDASVTVTFDGQTSDPAPVRVVRRNLGVFTVNGAGTGPAILRNSDSASNAPPDQQLNSILNSAKPGQLVTLYGTGLGPVQDGEDKVPLPGGLDMQLTIYIGLLTGEVIYAGRAGPDCCAQFEPGGFKIPAGVDQIIFRIPEEAPQGCYVPIVVVAGLDRNDPSWYHDEGVVGNHTTISISSSGGICNDPLGLSGEELERIQKSAGSQIGAISLSRSFPLDTSLPQAIGWATGSPAKETVTADFRRYDARSLLASHGIFGLPAAGTCLWLTGLPPDLLPVDPVQPVRIDAGAVLNLTGPNGVRQLAADEMGQYGAVFTNGSPMDRPTYLTPGSYTIDNGEGGRDVGPFRAEFVIPPPVTWTNKTSFLRDPPRMFRWSGGDPDSYVVISVLYANFYAACQTICVAENSAGSIMLPYVLWWGNSGTFAGGTFGDQPVFIGIGSLSRPARIFAPGLDTGLVVSTILTDAVYHNN